MTDPVLAEARAAVPPNLRRPSRADRFLSGLIGVARVYQRLSLRSVGHRPPVVPVNRDLSLVVRENRVVAEEVRSLVLTGPGPLPSWRPGAHLDLLLPSGQVRQYSLCGDPADRDHYRIAVRRIPGGSGSAEAHELGEGTEVTVRGPRNAFRFVPAPAYLFVAGGIGITPILPMVHAAAAAGADWRLVYTGRTRDSMPFLDQLSTVDQDRVWIRPDTEFGVPASGAELLELAPSGAHVYCCGPVPMLTSIRTDLPASGARTIHFERFGTPPIVDGRPFLVRLERSGTVLPVPADRSALEVIRQARPDVAYSCRQGFCGTCRVRVLATETGTESSEPETGTGEDTMLICVDRRPHGTVTLDL